MEEVSGSEARQGRALMKNVSRHRPRLLSSCSHTFGGPEEERGTPRASCEADIQAPDRGCRGVKLQPRLWQPLMSRVLVFPVGQGVDAALSSHLEAASGSVLLCPECTLGDLCSQLAR